MTVVLPPELEFLPYAERRKAYYRERRRLIKDGGWSPMSTQSIEVRLLAKLDRENGFAPGHAPELGPCWPWLGAVNGDGYGVISVGGRHVYVHRLALEIALGRPLRDGMLSCHRCDYKPCGRPAHLYEGTQSENVIDTWARIRRPAAERRYAEEAAVA